ncbi:hypothetical protein DDV21_001490 [Streptococcus chenjunshii]|uniref:Uncharacterized protein n=1 Tax=Streptococcus chenjunshii TaxID=2173853 RepID=A0A372KNA4_9STRE|nr:hypothetical protein DDV21_001490 [Streptococcus chenjunshii]RFU51346.1 hypothetical protein DDV22_04145 [Streptococcus chenjunshii]RFU53780.1 hypothetical protein DDV23_02605 [Streptococcus chenjunshii]
MFSHCPLWKVYQKKCFETFVSAEVLFKLTKEARKRKTSLMSKKSWNTIIVPTLLYCFIDYNG